MPFAEGQNVTLIIGRAGFLASPHDVEPIG
jgi:hypothetical protein